MKTTTIRIGNIFSNLVSSFDIVQNKLNSTIYFSNIELILQVCMVVGANDITNEAAKTVEGCAIYGMPVIEVDENFKFHRQKIDPK